MGDGDQERLERQRSRDGGRGLANRSLRATMAAAVLIAAGMLTDATTQGVHAGSPAALYDVDIFLRQPHPFLSGPSPAPAVTYQSPAQAVPPAPRPSTTFGTTGYGTGPATPPARTMAGGVAPVPAAMMDEGTDDEDGLYGIFSEVRLGALAHDTGPFSSNQGRRHRHQPGNPVHVAGFPRVDLVAAATSGRHLPFGRRDASGLLRPDLGMGIHRERLHRLQPRRRLPHRRDVIRRSGSQAARLFVAVPGVHRPGIQVRRPLRGDGALLPHLQCQPVRFQRRYGKRRNPARLSLLRAQVRALRHQSLKVWLCPLSISTTSP